METSAEFFPAGGDPSRELDAVFINAPLRDYTQRPRFNDITLPVLGMGYIATYAAHHGFNVGLIDAEALGLGVNQIIEAVNKLSPRWVGFNALAPTYQISARIAEGLNDSIAIMVGGAQAKAMPREILTDPRFRRCEAVVSGEGETRVVELLKDPASRINLPGVMWLDPTTHKTVEGIGRDNYLNPELDELPFVDRGFLINDPYLANDGRVEANMVGARGCPYNCSFCGAARSANPDVTIRSRSPENILAEMEQLHDLYGVTAFRFVDDLFLGSPRYIHRCLECFHSADVGNRYVWDATGRINVINHLDDEVIESLKLSGCRELALGIESGSQRLLDYMGKRISPEMTVSVIRRLTQQGIWVKGYFILGFPTETRAELLETIDQMHRLWRITENYSAEFRVSVFEFRPYPGTVEWDRLLTGGLYNKQQLLAYSSIDLAEGSDDEYLNSRDEFNFSVNLQFGETPIAEIREHLTAISREQHRRTAARRPQEREG